MGNHRLTGVEPVRIETPRFFLRALTVDDATRRYLSWLADADSQRFIHWANRRRTLEDLREYIRVRETRSDVLFLGMFARSGNMHIGNVKFEPVDSRQGFAVMGMLIGEPSWRGRGVAAEVLEACSRWLSINRGISEIVLGVERENVTAIRAYSKAGFRLQPTSRIAVDPATTSTMVRSIGDC